MARPRKSVPKYDLHKSSGQARVRLGGREVYLGKYNSPESRAAYARLVAELATTAERTSPERTPTAGHHSTIDDVLLAFWRHAEKHYRRPDGTATNELVEYRLCFAPLRELYGTTPAASFGPLGLKAVRQKFIASGLCRSTINARVRRLKHVFKFAAAEELIPVTTYQALLTLSGLQRGRTAVPEPEPVEPVAEAVVQATLPFLRPSVRAMVELQLLTGCRPGEIVLLRPSDTDVSGDVWLFSPKQHKNAHRGKGRIVAIGPRGQEVLKPFLPDDPNVFCFSPRAEVERLHAERSASRKTPKYRSHMARNVRKRVCTPLRPPAERYTPASYARAIARGCDRAFPPPAPLAKLRGETAKQWDARLTPKQREELKQWQESHRWAPNRLRHTRATEIRKRYGIEAAGATLGHDQLSTTELYTTKRTDLAVKIASEVG